MSAEAREDTIRLYQEQLWEDQDILFREGSLGNVLDPSKVRNSLF